MIVTNTVEHVQKEHVTLNNQQANPIGKIGNPAKLAPLIIPSSTVQLKAAISFRALLESDGLNVKRVNSGWKCCCPFHADRTPSFSIHPDDDRGHCFGCGWQGDIFSYVQDRMGITFVEAINRLDQQDTLRGSRTKTTVSAKQQAGQESRYSEKELEDISLYTGRLAQEQWLAERVAGVENWKAETIANLAREGHLGWAGDALAFIYKTGYKLRRWPGREFWWEQGRPHLWRYEKIAQVEEIWVCEGETDAISLIDKGVETVAGVAVVAAPSATSFRLEFAPYFQGKRVLVCFDADEAGRAGAAKVHEILKSVTSSLRDFNPKEVG